MDPPSCRGADKIVCGTSIPLRRISGNALHGQKVAKEALDLRLSPGVASEVLSRRDGIKGGGTNVILFTPTLNGLKWEDLNILGHHLFRIWDFGVGLFNSGYDALGGGL